MNVGAKKSTLDLADDDTVEDRLFLNGFSRFRKMENCFDEVTFHKYMTNNNAGLSVSINCKIDRNLFLLW